MIKSINQLIDAINSDLSRWGTEVKPWFRGESDNQLPLRPKIADYSTSQENHLMQSFRRQAGGLSNVPVRGETDLWLFLAQHYGVPTRLLDWTEGALHALYFAINRNHPFPRVYMLNPHKLNELAGMKADFLNYPLTWSTTAGTKYISLAWRSLPLSPSEQKLFSRDGVDFDVPIAFPATYQDQRMIAQKSCFTIHGTSLKSIQDILSDKNVNLEDYLCVYKIARGERNKLLKELSVLGISGATIFPDLDHLAEDLKIAVQQFPGNLET